MKKNTLAPMKPRAPMFNEHGYTQRAWEADEAECIPLCRECYSEEIGEVCAGDEGWTVCRSCQSVEQGYVYCLEDEMEEIQS